MIIKSMEAPANETHTFSRMKSENMPNYGHILRTHSSVQQFTHQDYKSSKRCIYDVGGRNTELDDDANVSDRSTGTDESEITDRTEIHSDVVQPPGLDLDDSESDRIDEPGRRRKSSRT